MRTQDKLEAYRKALEKISTAPVPPPDGAAEECDQLLRRALKLNDQEKFSLAAALAEDVGYDLVEENSLRRAPPLSDDVRSALADAFDEADYAVLYKIVPDSGTTTSQEFFNAPTAARESVAAALRSAPPCAPAIDAEIWVIALLELLEECLEHVPTALSERIQNVLDQDSPAPDATVSEPESADEITADQFAWLNERAAAQRQQWAEHATHGGWQTVPKEPTKEMIQACIWALDRWREKNGNVQGYVPPGEKYQVRWRAMLAAAPMGP